MGPPDEREGQEERGGGKEIERRGTDIRQKREQREIGLGLPDEREGQRERIRREGEAAAIEHMLDPEGHIPAGGFPRGDKKS